MEAATMGAMARALCIALLALAAAAPAAGADVVWLCRPGLADNPCEIPQDTTYQGKPDRVITPPTGERGVDCFYVYPTVSNQLSPNADKSRDPELESIAKYQAARFNTQCRLWAPIYRQATLYSIEAGGADRELAYSDVLEAWRDYVSQAERNRGVVLIGHSQGTGMLRRLLRTEIEAQPAQLRRVVSAILLGGNVTVPAGKIVGGDFRRTPLCTRRAQVACVVAYSSFATDPPEDARFGRSRPPAAPNPAGFPGGPGYAIACTDPRPLAGNPDEPLRILTPSEPFATGPIQAGIVITSGGPPPSAETTWVVPPDRFKGGCRDADGAHVLRYDPIGNSRRPMWFPDDTWGTHLIDVNIGLEPIVSLVAQQARRWRHPVIRIRARCGRRGVHTRLVGPDRGFVRRARIRVGVRVVRATLRLRLGAARRMTLTAPRPRCARS
jgi:hypothetical protein